MCVHLAAYHGNTQSPAVVTWDQEERDEWNVAHLTFYTTCG